MGEIGRSAAKEIFDYEKESVWSVLFPEFFVSVCYARFLTFIALSGENLVASGGMVSRL